MADIMVHISGSVSVTADRAMMVRLHSEDPLVRRAARDELELQAAKLAIADLCDPTGLATVYTTAYVPPLELRHAKKFEQEEVSP